jgi:hypothetical protein
MLGSPQREFFKGGGQDDWQDRGMLIGRIGEMLIGRIGVITIRPSGGQPPAGLSAPPGVDRPLGVLGGFSYC